MASKYPSDSGESPWISRLLALVCAVTVTCAGCGHARTVQGPERTYVVDEDASGVGAGLGTGGSGYDCDDALNTCFNTCWESARKPYPHTENNEWYYKHCTRECRKEYMSCIEEQEKEEAERVKKHPPLEFSNLDRARDWIQTHKSELVLGTVVIVAGTAFILVTGGSGALLLAPLAL